eukprot:TRINITY_DN16674_c0_g1_i1.p1 TRINITY_DN16674_c0_g1~~TRINITY_DN16674_c0_g1_i1.p1  ORF type:complete len:1037 (+),score=155.95 TRINITY_DN16674_c0_g1_i1:97-3207(+)
MDPFRREDTLRITAQPFPRDDTVEEVLSKSTVEDVADIFRETPPRHCCREVSPHLESHLVDLNAIGISSPHGASKGALLESLPSHSEKKFQASRLDDVVAVVLREFDALRTYVSDTERRILNCHGAIQASTPLELKHHFPRTKRVAVPTSEVDTPPTELAMMSTSKDSSNQTTASTQDTYAPGDRVFYWSVTAGKPIGAIVRRNNADGSYDLNVKRHVNIDHISKTPQMLSSPARPVNGSTVRTNTQDGKRIYDDARPISSRPTLAQIINMSGVPEKPLHLGVAREFKNERNKKPICISGDKEIETTAPLKTQMPVWLSKGSSSDKVALTSEAVVNGQIASSKFSSLHDIGSGEDPFAGPVSPRPTLAEVVRMSGVPVGRVQIDVARRCEEEFEENQIYKRERATVSTTAWNMEVPNCVSSESFANSVDRPNGSWKPSVRHNVGSFKRSLPTRRSSRLTLAQAIDISGVPGNHMVFGVVGKSENHRSEKDISNTGEKLTETIAPLKTQLAICVSDGSSSDDEHEKQIQNRVVPTTEMPSRVSDSEGSNGGNVARKSESSVESRILFKRKRNVARESVNQIKSWQERDKVRSANGRKGFVAALLASPLWDLFVCAMILVYTVFVGVQVDYSTTHVATDTPAMFYVVGYAFNVFFLVELLLRIWNERMRFFSNCEGSERWWNYFDLFLVSSAIIEVIVDIQIMSGANQADGSEVSSTQLRIIRILKLARLMKVFRVARIVRYIHSLRTLISSIVGTLRSVSCALILMFLIIYVFGMLMVQSVRDHITDYGDSIADLDGLEMFWGTLLACMFTLFKSIVGGISWHDCVVPLDDLPQFLLFVFLIYVLFMYFAVLNVITAVFCENAIQSKRNDQDVVMQEQLLDKSNYVQKLRNLFNLIDEDASGSVTCEELKRFLDRELSGAFFEYLELDVSCASDIMRLIDLDGSGELDIDEFVDGICHLRGSARSVDLAELGYHLQTFQQQILRRLGTLEGAVGASNRRADTLAAKGLAAQPDLTSLGDTVELPSQMKYKSSSSSDF